VRTWNLIGFTPPSQNFSPAGGYLRVSILNVCFWAVLETRLRPHIGQRHQADRNGCALSPTSVVLPQRNCFRKAVSGSPTPCRWNWIRSPDTQTPRHAWLKRSGNWRFNITSHHHTRKRSRNVWSFISRILMRLADVALRCKTFFTF
jgi:hypothetical protein